MRLLLSPAMGLLADTVNDVSSTRKVYLLAGGLAVLGIALIVITVWFWKSTRHDPELLAPLEAMGSRKFRALDERGQQHVLDTSRPPNAQPMRWGVVRGEPEVEQEVDLRANHDDDRLDYDDLREPDAADSANAVAADSAGAAAVAASGPDVGTSAISAIDADLLADFGSARLPAGNGKVGGRDTTSPMDRDMTVVAVAPTASPASAASIADAGVIDAPGGAATVEPLIIVPIDHDLPRAEPEPKPAPAPIVVSSSPLPVALPVEVEEVHEDDDAAGRPIDPLLRMFDRNDT